MSVLSFRQNQSSTPLTTEQTHSPNWPIQAEARELIARFGINSYSSYLIKYNRRPDAIVARSMGLALGCRVRASDGSLQPEMCAKSAKDRKSAASSPNKSAHNDALMSLWREFSQIPLEKCFQDTSLALFDNDDTLAKVDIAIECLKRISRELSEHGKVCSS